MVFLGDYIYEHGIAAAGGCATPRRRTTSPHRGGHPRPLPAPVRALQVGPRPPGGAPERALDQTWDDHEVQDNYAGVTALRHGPARFERRRPRRLPGLLGAQPVRVGPPSRPGLPRAPAGDVRRPRQFHVLDTRQYRSPQVDGPTVAARLAGATDPTRTMPAAQEAWLAEGLARSTTTWNLVAQQVLLGGSISNRAPSVQPGRVGRLHRRPGPAPRRPRPGDQPGGASPATSTPPTPSTSSASRRASPSRSSSPRPRSRAAVTAPRFSPPAAPTAPPTPICSTSTSSAATCDAASSRAP